MHHNTLTMCNILKAHANQMTKQTIEHQNESIHAIHYADKMNERKWKSSCESTGSNDANLKWAYVWILINLMLLTLKESLLLYTMCNDDDFGFDEKRCTVGAFHFCMSLRSHAWIKHRAWECGIIFFFSSH